MGKFNNPTQVVLISSRLREGKEVKDNIMPATWWTKTSFQPNLYLISVGKTRYSHELISKSKVFVINFVPYELKDKILFCGKYSGRDMDKFKETGIGKEEAEKIDCVVVRESLAWLECKVKKEVESGDHTIFIGEVVNAKFKKEGKRPFQYYKNEFTTTLK